MLENWHLVLDLCPTPASCADISIGQGLRAQAPIWLNLKRSINRGATETSKIAPSPLIVIDSYSAASRSAVELWA